MIRTPLLLRTQGWTGRAIGFAVGALAVLGQAPFHLWPVTLACLAILFARLRWAGEAERPGRAGFGTGFWWALGYFSAGVFWISSAFVERGPEFIPLIPFMVGGLALLLSLIWGLAGSYVARLRGGGLAAVLGFAAIYSLAEFFRGHAMGGFPWNLPGYIFEAGSAPSQVARWVTVYGLSTIVLLSAAALGQALFWRRRLWPVLVCVLPIIGIYAVGAVRLMDTRVEDHADIRLRIVSVPFKQSDKMSPETSIGIVNDFLTASYAPGLEEITHLIWPEGAVNGVAVEDEYLLQTMGKSLASFDDTPPVWLLNSLITERERGRLRYYNASVAVTFDALGDPAIATSDRKVKLVPFGEHIPFMDWMEDVQMPLISTNLASISPGDKKRTARFPGLPPVSSQLCYEIIFPGFTPVAGDPQWILNQSNDAWYGRSTGPPQHANQARYRAIETGLPVVRAASNGVSGVIDPYGRLQKNAFSASVFYSDATLPKPLKLNRSGRMTIFVWLLINLLTCGILTIISRRRVGLRQ
jgi:apolipoprotein N-acyltransferase